MPVYAIVCVCLILLYLLSRTGPKKSTRYGSGELIYRHDVLKPKNTGLLIDGKLKRLAETNSYRHICVVASSGAGKTQRYCLPNILQASSERCLVITDPIGELYQLTNGALKSQGYEVEILDFGDPLAGIRYNPFVALKNQDDIHRICETLFTLSNDGAKTEGIWKTGAISVLSTLLKCLMRTPDACFHNIANLIRLLQYANDEQKITPFIAQYAPDESTVEAWAAYQRSEEKVMAGQLSGAIACLSSFDTHKMKLLTATHDLDFAALREKKTALFFKLPVGKSARFSGLLSLIYSQLFESLLTEPLTAKSLPVYCLLEEFGNLKALPSFPEVIALIRSQKVSLSLIVQDFAQIYHRYGIQSAQTILGNCSSWLIYAGVKSPETLKAVHDQLGITTYTEAGSSHESARSVMTKDEVRRLEPDEALFLNTNLPGIKLTTTPLYRNKALLKRHKIRSEDGRLIPGYAPVAMPRHENEEIEYFPL